MCLVPEVIYATLRLRVELVGHVNAALVRTGFSIRYTEHTEAGGGGTNLEEWSIVQGAAGGSWALKDDEVLEAFINQVTECPVGTPERNEGIE